jgi:hypothetical protein
MKTTVCGSFIICCEFGSRTCDDLNSSNPEYQNRAVSVIQCKVKQCKDKDTIMMYELIYVSEVEK